MSASFPNVFAKSVKRLSVIIVTYRSERDIYDCLRSLWQHCDIPKEQLEVIVVDNSPESDGMFARLRQLYGQELLLIHNTHNGGYGQGNNVGIRQASAPVILIMNPDVRLIEPVFKTAVEAFENDTALCMYGMKQMLSDTVKSPLSFDCTNAMNGYAAPIVSSLCNKLDLFLPRWMYLSGACFFIRKQPFEEVGLFDEDVFMYGEENDIHARMVQRFGPHMIFNRHLRYVHLTLGRPTSPDTQKKMLASLVLTNGKRGISARHTLTNRLHYFRTRWLSARVKQWLGRNNAEHLAGIETIIKELKSQLQQ